MLCNDGALAVERWPVGLDGEGAVVTHAYASIYVPFKISNEIDNACIKISLYPLTNLIAAHACGGFAIILALT